MGEGLRTEQAEMSPSGERCRCPHLRLPSSPIQLLKCDNFLQLGDTSRSQNNPGSQTGGVANEQIMIVGDNFWGVFPSQITKDHLQKRSLPQPPLAMLPFYIFMIVLQQSVVMVLSIFGNLLLLFVIFRGNRVARRSISPVQLLLIHTCVADLLFALLSLGTEILTLLMHPHFLGSNFLCKLMRYCQMLPHYASPFLLVAISADRFQAICFPLANFRASRYRRPNALAATAWGLALLLSIPQIFVWERRDTIDPLKGPLKEECATIFPQNQKSTARNVYVIAFNVLAWLLPSIMAAFFYCCVCVTVWMSGSRAPKMSEKEALNENLITQDYIDQLRKQSNGFRMQESEFDRKRMQTVRLTMTIVACNFVLWMPFSITNVLFALWPKMLSDHVYLWGMILGNINSSVNPWIYIFFNRGHVKKAFKRCRQPGTPGSTPKGDNKASVTSFRKTSAALLTPASSLKQNGTARLQKNRVSFNTKEQNGAAKTDEPKKINNLTPLAAILSAC